MKALLALLGLFAAPVLAATTAVSTGSLIQGLVWIIVIALVFYLLWWLVGYMGLPEPFNKIIRVIIAVVAVLILINFLLGFAGTPLLNFR